MRPNHFRAGKLDRSIIIETKSETIDGNGTPLEVWTALGPYRAELVTDLRGVSATSEQVRESGAVDSIEQILTLRMRWIAGLTVADRLQYEGRAFDIIGLVEIPRGRGWEIRCRHRGVS